MSKSEVFNEDCMVGMARYPDKFFDLAIVDPPYGIGASRDLCKHKFESKNWDSEPPGADYFNELLRISKNQIIWGGNYFNLGPCRCYIVWDKKQPENFTLSQSEFAWTSFDSPAKSFYMRRQGDVRIHPTQKPAALYEWLLRKYANQGCVILDTHMGSQSSRMAAYDMGFDFVGFELDPDYYAAGNKRFAAHTAQGQLFDDPDLYFTTENS